MSESECTDEMVKNMNLTIRLLREKLINIQETLRLSKSVHTLENTDKGIIEDLNNIFEKFLEEDYG